MYPGRQRRSASLSPELFKLGVKHSRFDLKALSKDDILLNSTVSLCGFLYIKITFFLFFKSFPWKMLLAGNAVRVGSPNVSQAIAFPAI